MKANGSLLIFDTAAAALGAALVWLFGEWDALLIVLLCFIALDYLSGVINAIVKKQLDSDVGFRGLLKKGAILLVVVVAAQVDKLLGGGVFRSMACTFYIANEGLSVLENVSAAGVPLPAKLIAVLQKLRDSEPASEQPEETAQKKEEQPNG